MISIKTSGEIEKMRLAGRLARNTLDMIEPHIHPGVSTEDINGRCHRFILDHEAIPAPLNYRGFPKSICTSINDVVCHGIPSSFDILKDGDIINVDVTVILDGYHGDTSRTFLVGDSVSKEIRILVERTQKAMEIGIQSVKPGGRFGNIGRAIEDYLRPYRYGIVRTLGGHGIGRKFHEDPFVPHYHTGKPGPKFEEGMTFTVEPMINLGTHEVYTDEDDGWTVYTQDQKSSAQFEHTLAITRDGVEILT